MKHFPLILQRPALDAATIPIPFCEHTITAGFPSPADDYIENRLSLDEHLIPHKHATFFVRAKGNSMEEAGIGNGDILVVDKSLHPVTGDVVIAVVEGEFTVKYLARQGTAPVLRAANRHYRDITFSDGQELQIWGVVTAVVKKFR